MVGKYKKENKKFKSMLMMVVNKNYKQRITKTTRLYL